MGALSDPEVGKFLNDNFLSAQQQVGDFEVIEVGGRTDKRGGNVASYFCTSSGLVIHAVLGPASAEELLREGHWAMRAFEAARQKTSVIAQRRIMSAAHLERLEGKGRPAVDGTDAVVRWAVRRVSSHRARRVHELLAKKPLPTLKTIFDDVFGGLLHESLTDAEAVRKYVQKMMEQAQKQKRPILWMLRRDGRRWRFERESIVRTHSRPDTEAERLLQSPSVQPLLAHVVGVAIDVRDLPALSSDIKVPPGLADLRGGRTSGFFVSDPSGEVLRSLSTWSHPDAVATMLAAALVEFAESQSHSRRQLSKLRSALRRSASGMKSPTEQAAVKTLLDGLDALIKNSTPS